jgi:hypothetical protein
MAQLASQGYTQIQLVEYLEITWEEYDGSEYLAQYKWEEVDGVKTLSLDGVPTGFTSAEALVEDYLNNYYTNVKVS